VIRVSGCSRPAGHPIQLSIVRILDKKNDTSLALALIASAAVIFQQPLRIVIDAAHDMELRYHIDLIPGLTVLVATFAFHQYKKWQQARAAAQSAAAEAEHERARAVELERLVALGRSLGSALEPLAVRQVFWRYLPEFARERELWMTTVKATGVDLLVRDATAATQRTPDVLEAIAAEAINAPAGIDVHGEGVAVGEDLCFQMVVGQTVLGIVGVRNVPELTRSERRALGAAVALLAIAIRNVQLLTQTRESSVRDHLTGCFNRSHGIETLANELKRASRTGHPVAVLMFDLDQFKAVNDQYGHLTGDAMLAEVGLHVSRTLRASDTKCRYGGDEFLVILPDTPLAGAERAADALILDLGLLQIRTDTGMISPTVSVGVAVSEEGENDALSLVARADAALYRAKQLGRNRYTVAPAGSDAVM
jgi:diguanylate cyclase (GGDEF)-like protein